MHQNRRRRGGRESGLSTMQQSVRNRRNRRATEPQPIPKTMFADPPLQPSRNHATRNLRNHRATMMQQGATEPQPIDFQPPQPRNHPLKGRRNGCAPRAHPKPTRANSPPGCAYAPPPGSSALTTARESHDMTGNSQTIAEQDGRPARQAFGRGRRNSPHHARMCVESRDRRIINAAGSLRPSRRHQPSMSTAIVGRSPVRLTHALAVAGLTQAARSRSLTSGLPIESSNRIGPMLAPTRAQAPCKRLNSHAQSASGQRFAYPLHLVGRDLARVLYPQPHCVSSIRVRARGNQASSETQDCQRNA
jgi:hypothetical protein